MVTKSFVRNSLADLIIPPHERGATQTDHENIRHSAEEGQRGERLQIRPAIRRRLEYRAAYIPEIRARSGRVQL